MARSVLNAVVREINRQQRIRVQQENSRIRENTRQLKEVERNLKLLEKENKQLYLAARLEEAEERNLEIAESINALREILDKAHNYQDPIKFTSLRKSDKYPDLQLPAELEKPITAPKESDFVDRVKEPNKIQMLIPSVKKKYSEAIQSAKEDFQIKLAEHQEAQRQREEAINKREAEYECSKAQFERELAEHNQQIDEFNHAYHEGDPDAICAYCSLVLERSEYPERFPKEFRIAYVSAPKQLVIEYEVPNIEVIPSTVLVRYVKTRDVIEEKPRSISEIKAIYQDVVAAVCLRTINELFESDQGNHIDVVVFNGFVQSVDPATGKDVRPCLISVQTTRERFGELVLSKIDKTACLRNLGADVSPRASELQAVKPVVEFNMVDKRFVEESDVLNDLESRPNLMELNPFEFENFISNLFNLIGFDSKLTRSSKDGGIDVVAFDPRPILGGKVVIQAKRYKNVVGVAAVRDLYGTMINEGASKGILVTTSHYGPDAYDFSKDKPIELIDGGGLLYLLKQNGYDARIEFPEDWDEPAHYS